MTNDYADDDYNHGKRGTSVEDEDKKLDSKYSLSGDVTWWNANNEVDGSLLEEDVAKASIQRRIGKAFVGRQAAGGDASRAEIEPPDGDTILLAWQLQVGHQQRE